MKKQLHGALMDVCRIIEEFHRKKVWLGNLNLSSFKTLSPFDSTLRLVDYNFTSHVSEF